MASNVLPLEMSSAAVGYGNLGGACHFIPGVINTCLPVAFGGTAGLAPTATQVYAPAGSMFEQQVLQVLYYLLSLIEELELLYKLVVCKMFKAMTDHADSVTAQNELC